MNSNPARGMRDFLPADVRRREYVISVIKEVYQKYGFEPLETPAVENIETLMGKYGEEGNQLIFKILKRGEGASTGEADLALRYDLTVPTARVVAQYKNDLPKFFKRYQIQPVWRADRPARGRYREFYQCDVDVFGTISVVVEAELCTAVSDVLRRLGFNDFKIRINHRELLLDLLSAAGIENDKQTDALVAIDKLDKIGTDGVLRELNERSIAPEAGQSLLNFLADTAERKSNLEILDAIGEFVGGATAGANELRRIVELTQDLRINIDPSLARGLSYYTGAIFEIVSPAFSGSLAGGGRYDNLIGMFSGEKIPACGFSIGLERIILIMTENGMFPEHLTATPADVLVTLWNAETIDDSLALANELRAQGLRVSVYPEADKLGDEERTNNTVTIKYLETGNQETISRDKLATDLKL
jgi:histidyl-tRNA synthetase